MFLQGLSPAFTHLFLVISDPVMGGGLLFGACLVTINGFQLLSTVLMDIRRAGVIAFTLILAVARVENAPLFELLPTEAKPMASSALGTGFFLI